MLMTHAQSQGLTTDELRVQAFQVLDTLSEEQLLVVVAYARWLMGDSFRPKDHALEELVEERV
jgi:hypothetical protein